jgi:chemotaxis signal transduction protein
VLDLRRRFGLEATPADSSTRILITRLGRTPAGLIVDDVTDVSTTDDESHEIDPSEVLGINLRQYASRVVQANGSLVIVIDPATLLTETEVSAVEAAATEEAPDAQQT